MFDREVQQRFVSFWNIGYLGQWPLTHLCACEHVCSLCNMDAQARLEETGKNVSELSRQMIRLQVGALATLLPLPHAPSLGWGQRFHCGCIACLCI